MGWDWLCDGVVIWIVVVWWIDFCFWFWMGGWSVGFYEKIGDLILNYVGGYLWDVVC